MLPWVCVDVSISCSRLYLKTKSRRATENGVEPLREDSSFLDCTARTSLILGYNNLSRWRVHAFERTRV